MDMFGQNRHIKLIDQYFSAMKIIKVSLKQSILIVSAIFTTITFTGSAQGAYSILPKAGQCFMHTNADVDADSPKKNPIPCSSTHNAEIILVAKWPMQTPPWQMEYQDAWDIANSICGFDAAAGNLNQNYFNYWAWYTPTKTSWAAGQRWLRCDGMYITSGSGSNDVYKYKFRSWKGLRS